MSKWQIMNVYNSSHILKVFIVLVLVEMCQSSNFSNSLRSKLCNWKLIGASEKALSWIESGVKLPFNCVPNGFEIENRSLSAKKRLFITNEIKSLLAIGVIEKCIVKPTCVSPINSVPKSNGKQRLIIDLRHLNEHCSPPKFVYEDIRTVKQIVKYQDVGVTIDLKNGFHHVPVHSDYKQYLGFKWDNEYYQWAVLPFGSNCSPYYFAKLVREIVRFLRTQGIKVVAYVDDFILLATRKYITSHCDELVNTLLDLGWHINYEKSVLTPSTIITFLGYIINTSGRSGFAEISIAVSRIKTLKKCIKLCLKSDFIMAKRLAKIAGLCVSMSMVILPAKLLLRNVYRALSSRRNWESEVCLNTQARVELEWWLLYVDNWNQTPIIARPIDIQLTTDASHLGWGAVLETYGMEASGQWNSRMSHESSNYRELMAILMSLKSFEKKLAAKCVQIRSDNITAIAYINGMGGPCHRLTKLAKTIWSYALALNMHLQCVHLTGALNTHADALSRIHDKYNWMLHPRIFQVLDSIWGPHSIDRFASCTNTQLPRYNSWFRDPHSEAVDALAQQNWDKENNYVNCPFRLIPRVLDIVRKQKAKATIIAPIWPSQPWFQQLKRLTVDKPLRIPNNRRSFMYMGPQAEPMKNKAWRLCAWRICGGIH